jgi:hypothetical protein
MGRVCWGAAVLVVLVHCASGPGLDPTPERPKVGCILPTMRQQGQVQGKLLPEVVRIIGVTSFEDGQRYKVLRAGEFDTARWQPWEREKIRFNGCGMEVEAFRDLMRASKPTGEEER